MINALSSPSSGVNSSRNGRFGSTVVSPAENSQQGMGGYNVRLTNGSTSDHLRCASCKKILRKPWQLSCGHRFCASCLSCFYRSSESVDARCPVDGTSIIKEETFHDVFAEREVMSLTVHCPSKEMSDGADSCTWQGQIRSLEDHTEVCDFMLQLCPNNCGEEIARKNMTEHLARKCKARPSPCQHCQQEVPADKMTEHMSSCPKVPVACPNSCSTRLVARKQMAKHLQVCPKQVVKCFYHTMGCDFEGQRCDLPGHHDLRMAYHLQICCMQTQTTQIVMNKLSQENSMLAEKLSSLESNFKHLQELVEDCSGRKAEHLSPHKKPMFRPHKNTSTQSPELPTEGDLPVQQTAELLEQLTATREQRLVAIERSVAFHDVQLSELDIRQNIQDTKMSNGVLVWKISDFKRRQQDAISGKTPSLYSPPFYTSPAGYKVCARLYPNGDGVGRGTHLSFFFVVMKGDFDTLLPWPFQQKVSLILMDQNRINPRNVVKTFRPDAKSSSFQRPKNDMNVASGCPLFAPLSSLNNSSYLLDDNLYLKVIIHPHGLQAPDQA